MYLLLLKMHKIPSGARFIIGGKKCINKQLHKQDKKHQHSNYLNPINFSTPLIFAQYECVKINSTQIRPFFYHWVLENYD